MDNILHHCTTPRSSPQMIRQRKVRHRFLDVLPTNLMVSAAVSNRCDRISPSIHMPRARERSSPPPSAPAREPRVARMSPPVSRWTPRTSSPGPRKSDFPETRKDYRGNGQRAICFPRIGLKKEPDFFPRNSSPVFLVGGAFLLGPLAFPPTPIFLRS